MKIRDARPRDIAAVVKIYNAAIPARLATADLKPVSVVSRQAWFAEHTSGRRPLWVAEEDDQIAAWLSFQSFYGRPAYDATVELSVYVAPGHQRRGYGGVLLARAIDWAPGHEIKNLLGFIFSHNAPSLALFGASGFARWAHLPRVAILDGIERDLLILGRSVP